MYTRRINETDETHQNVLNNNNKRCKKTRMAGLEHKLIHFSLGISAQIIETFLFQDSTAEKRN